MAVAYGGVSERDSKWHSVGGIRLSDGSWWAQQRDHLRRQRLVADIQGVSLSSSVDLTECFADLIFAYWSGLYSRGLLRPDQAVPLVQWGAGTGRFVYRLLSKLRIRLRGSSLADLQPVYIACEEDLAAVEQMRAHPFLEPDIAAGALRIAHVVGCGLPQLQQAGLAGMPAPWVLIANEVFGELDSDWAGVFHGEVFDAIAEVADERDSVSWQRPLSPSVYAGWESVLADYAGRLDGVPVLLPTGARQFLSSCSMLCEGRCLFVGTDRGIASERQLRAAGYVQHMSFSPVNFDALSRWQRAAGAQSWTSDSDPEGRLLQVALWERSEGAIDDLFDGLCQRATRCIQGQTETLLLLLQQMAPELSCEQMLTVVRATCDDPRTVPILCESLLPKLDRLTVECGRQWQRCLEEIWHEYFPTASDDSVCSDLGTLAMNVGHWGLARVAFSTALALAGEEPDLFARLSCCEASTGRVRQALFLMERAAALRPDHAPFSESAAVLRERLTEWQSRLEAEPVLSLDRELTLEPLGAEHVGSLLFQFRDPQIAVMTRIPELTSEAEALAWVAEQQSEPGRVSYAVMHLTWGFVGVVSLQRADDAGFLYFWIGTDFQGSGFGQRAARLLLEESARRGVGHVFTCAYSGNQRSVRALQRLSFDALRVTAAPPDEDLCFFYRCANAGVVPAEDADSRLGKLLHSLSSPIQLNIPREEHVNG